MLGTLCIISLNPQNNATGRMLLTVTYRGEIWGSEKLSNLFQITQLVVSRARIGGQFCPHFSPTTVSFLAHWHGDDLSCFFCTLCLVNPMLGAREKSESHSVVSNTLWLHELYSPWNSPGQNTGVGSHSLLQVCSVKPVQICYVYKLHKHEGVPHFIVQLCPTLYDPMDGSMPGSSAFTISQSLLKFMSIELVMLSNHHILFHLFFLLPSIFPSIRVFSNKLTLCIRWPKYWSFSFSISPSNESSGLMSFRIDWLISLQSKGLARVFSTTIQKHQFFGFQPSLWSNAHICTDFWENHSFDYMDLCRRSAVAAF